MNSMKRFEFGGLIAAITNVCCGYSKLYFSRHFFHLLVGWLFQPCRFTSF